MRVWTFLPMAGLVGLLVAADHVLTADDFRVRTATVGTGVRLEYVEAGSPTGRPVLFLHGYSDSWFSFSRVLERLPDDIRAIVPSQRGHGDSQRPDCCYHMTDFAADAISLLDALGIERATIVGHSMGSFVAQTIVTSYPDRVDRLVLIGSGTSFVKDLVLDLREQVESLSDPVPMDFVREFQMSTVHYPVPEAFMRRVVGESMKLPARIWRAALDGQLEADLTDDLPRVDTPTLLMAGDRDAIFPAAEQERLSDLILRSSLVTYEETGHALHWERPERFVRDLNAFLARR